MSDLKSKVEERLKNRENMCFAIQNAIIGLSKNLKILADADIETYQMLIEPDVLFNDSPIAPLKTVHWLTQFMIKKDMDFIGYALDGKHVIPNFHDMAKEASGWVLRFAKEKPKPKKGADAII